MLFANGTQSPDMEEPNEVEPWCVGHIRSELHELRGWLNGLKRLPSTELCQVHNCYVYSRLQMEKQALLMIKGVEFVFPSPRGVYWDTLWSNFEFQDLHQPPPELAGLADELLKAVDDLLKKYGRWFTGALKKNEQRKRKLSDIGAVN